MDYLMFGFQHFGIYFEIEGMKKSQTAVFENKKNRICNIFSFVFHQSKYEINLVSRRTVTKTYKYVDSRLIFQNIMEQ